jgi:hypothetical protein
MNLASANPSRIKRCLKIALEELERDGRLTSPITTRAISKTERLFRVSLSADRERLNPSREAGNGKAAADPR